MTTGPGYYDRLDFNAPLSDARADAVAAALAARRPRTVLDIGCGWAELMLRILAVSPSTTGVGVDSDKVLVARGQANAQRRGLADRVRLIAIDGKEPVEPADIVLCVGSDHVYGHQGDALAALKANVISGGVLFFGTGYWQRPPTDEEAAALGAIPDELSDLAGLVDRATATGFHALDIQTANEDEWNAFESGYLADWEEWLMRHTDASDVDEPRTAEVRAAADRHRAGWLRGYRGVLGFAYLTLGVPAGEY